MAPSHRSVSERTETVVSTEAGPSGYIASRGGTKTIATPSLWHAAKVLLERPGVVGEVLGHAELQGVDEDRDGHAVALLDRPLDQPAVTGVESSHRRHETDRVALGAQHLEDAGKLLGSIDNGHRVTRHRCHREATTSSSEAAVSRRARATPAL